MRLPYIPCFVEFTGHCLSDETSSTGMGAGRNGNNQWEWEGNGNKTWLNVRSGIVMAHYRFMMLSHITCWFVS